MPHIKLDQRFPGIVSLFMYDKGMAKTLSAMAQELMRRPSPLSEGERELIAAYASKVNECQFCYRSHASCAAEYLGDYVVDMAIHEGYVEGLNDRLRHLCYLAGMVTLLQRDKIAELVVKLKDMGVSDQEIHDTVAIAAFFNMCNRYVDGLATTFEPGEEIQGGKSLAKYGYLMSIRRFFGEVLPSLFSKKPAMTKGLPR